MTDPKQTSSHGLEVISNPGSQPGDDRGERRRLPRINLSAEQFKLTLNGKIFSVVDLSRGGMAIRLLDKQDFLLFPVAARLEGTLNLAGEKHEVTASVMRLGAETVGCAFSGLSPDVQSSIERFLDPARLGSELKPIPSSEGGTLWYHGGSGTDLLFKRGADGQYFRMTLYVLGSYVQWIEGEGVSTGRVKFSDESSEPRGVMRLETLWLDADARADLSKLAVAKTLVLSSNLPEDFKKWCTRKLEA